tara:strand:- start:35 stop:262 length:228 start_codon:yes stop_codon:yes gene_type:complete
MTKKTIHNVITGEINTIDLSAEEETSLAERVAAKETEIAEHQAKLDEKTTLKASAKAKLIAGEPLTEAEADTLVL